MFRIGAENNDPAQPVAPPTFAGAAARFGTLKKDDERLEEFHRVLTRGLGVAVQLTATCNRRSMISFRWSAGGLTLRVHRIFVDADPEIWRAVVSFCRRPGRDNRAKIDEFIRLHQGRVGREAARTRVLNLDTEGKHFDLRELFDGLNRKHFKRACDARVTWGKNSRKPKTRGIQLGSYDPEANLIRIHRALDHAWTPQYVVESMLYHEMLHWLFRPRTAGARRVIHGRAFREAERAHPNYQRAQDWISKNLDRLLKG